MTTSTAHRDRYALSASLERLLSARIALTRERLLYAAIFAAAFALRFWDLGSRALHHDESIHAQWSWRLLQGDYTHSPIFHGPLYYHVQAVFFFFFGASDYTARMSAATFGLVLAALPLLLRKRLGPAGTMAAVAFIAFSPTLVYYSRFFREDIYMAVFTLLMVASMWRYIEDGRDRWLYLLATGFVGSVLVKEGAFLTFAVFLIYLDFYVAAILGRRMLEGRGLEGDSWRRLAMAFFLAPYTFAIVALWPFLGRVRRRFDLGEELPRPADLLILIGTFSLPLLTPAFNYYVLQKVGIVAEGRLNWELRLSNGVSTDDALLLIGLFSMTLSAAALVGLQWKPRVWATAFGVGTLVYLTFMTSFWTNPDGLVSGPWGSLDYWIEQQGVSRGDQPWFYYYLLMPAYEFLPLILSIGGLWWSAVRGSPFSRFLVVWLVGMFLALSWGAEKMPWLNVHLALPASILAAWTVQRAWDAWRERPAFARAFLPLASVALVAAGALALVVFLPNAPAFTAVRLVVFAAAVAVAVYAMRPFGRQAAPIALVVATIGGLAFFSLRTMTLAVYERGDIPQDMLIYTQSSPDIPRIKSQIDALAEASGKGFDLPIAVDSSDSFAWPWAWYLRDYKRVGYIDFTAGLPAGEYDVLLVNQSNAGRVNDEIASGAGGVLYGSPIKYPHRWWFDERYKRAMSVSGGVDCTAKAGECGPYRLATWKKIATGVFTGKWLDDWFTYWRDHNADTTFGVTTGDRRCNSCGSVDAFVYFPANFDPATGRLSFEAVQPPKPGTDGEGRLQFGGYGFQPGQFLEPIDAEADAAGNLYVIDARSKKLSKFDAQGNFLAAVDIRETPGSASEEAQPWGLAIAANGDVVVADTFGWRLRVFDKDLKPLRTIGRKPQPEAGKPPAADELYGPRDVAVDGAGNYWVTDGGHDRIVVFRPDGSVLATYGSEGAGPNQFNEPVGISIASDGTVFVADMYNARVVMLDGNGGWKGSFPVQGWGGQDVADKPYLEALGDGRVVVGWPAGNEVRVYQRDGRISGTVTGGSEGLSQPYGLVTTADGKLWVVEGGSGRLRQFPLP